MPSQGGSVDKQWQPFRVGDFVVMKEEMKSIFLSFREPGHSVSRRDVEKTYIVFKTKLTSFQGGDLSEGVSEIQMSAASGVTSREIEELWLPSSKFEHLR